VVLKRQPYHAEVQKARWEFLQRKRQTPRRDVRGAGFNAAGGFRILLFAAGPEFYLDPVSLTSHAIGKSDLTPFAEAVCLNSRLLTRTAHAVAKGHVQR